MMRPQLIVLTAMMPTSYLPHLCWLLTVSSFQGEAIVRGSPRDFDQREIEMQTFICLAKGLYVSKGLTLVFKFLRDHPVRSAVIFFNSRHQSQHFWDHLERKLNQFKLNVNVLHINGALHKTDKFWRIRLFSDKGHIREANFRVLVTTNAANVGINKSLISGTKNSGSYSIISSITSFIPSGTLSLLLLRSRSLLTLIRA